MTVIIDKKNIDICMKNFIRFLNHSCIQIEGIDTKILCDPWFEGAAFSNGWSLLHDNSHNINDLKFDYIWISHEHPDHFSIPTINKLKGSKKFLYQKTNNKKVKSFLEKKGHEVIELPNKIPTKVGDLLLTSVVCDGHDSSLIVKFQNGRVVININDARVDLNDHIEKDIIPLLKSDKVDLLMFQFSYANWAGNPGDFDIAKHQQYLVDKKNEYAISKLSPKMIMPFASFVYYSHEENFYWNENNWLNHVYAKYNSLNFKLLFPKPNQTIMINEIDNKDFSKENLKSLDFWQNLQNKIEKKYFSKSFTIHQMKAQYDIFLNQLHKQNSIFNLVNKHKNFFLKLKIIDLDIVIEVGLLTKSFTTLTDHKNEIVSEITSEIFILLFSQLFARGTVAVNSRIKFNYDLAHRFFLFFFIPYANNIGMKFDSIDENFKQMIKSIHHTSVMESITNFNKQSNFNMNNDINYLLRLFHIAQVK